MPTPQELQAMFDKQAIYEVVMRYSRAVDRIDMELWRSCFHPDATLLFEGLFRGSVDEMEPTVSQFLNSLDGTMHVISNHFIDVRGDVARGETYVNSYHWGTPRDDPQKNFTTGSRYIDRFERRGGEWRIADRQCLRSFVRLESGFVTNPPLEGWPSASRDRTDPVYAPF
ncbi:MAG: nuclear transport factor 2 family protein [Hyphomonadaceae bacterium]